MHRAFEIEEIFSNILHHCYSPPFLTLSKYKYVAPDLVALAGTCRTLKEPALDLLWKVLVDLSPLARCLPEASRRLSPEDKVKFLQSYSFIRPLMQDEWDTLRSYTRRVRRILNFECGLDQESIHTLSTPPTVGLLFPNLRFLRCNYISKRAIPPLHLCFPSLDFLYVGFEDLHLFQKHSTSFPNFSPDLKTLIVRVFQLQRFEFYKMEAGFIYRWQNLSSVICDKVTFDWDSLVHLSRMPALTRLEFALSNTLPASDAPLPFSKLHKMKIKSESLELASRLLFQVQLPATAGFTATIGSCPSREELSCFFGGLQISSAGNTIKSLWLVQSPDSSGNHPRSANLLLGLEDLRPCMQFSNLHHVSLSFECDVGLADSDMLALASAWPKLEYLDINQGWGWNTRSGITPGGLVRLLQTCRTLRGLSLALDTRGYAEPPPSPTPASLGLDMRSMFSINVLDSHIEAKSVTALATLFSGIMAHTNKNSFSSWYGDGMVEPIDVEAHRERWGDVFGRALHMLGRCADVFVDEDCRFCQAMGRSAAAVE